MLAIVLGGLALCSWLHAHPRQLPYGQCSEVFLRYKDADGVRAAFLKDFRVSDSVRVDVTLLVARDSATWADLVVSLCRDKNSDEFYLRKVFFKPVPRESGDRRVPDGLNNEYILVASFPDLTVGVFHLETLQQQTSIIDSYVNSLIQYNKETTI